MASRRSPTARHRRLMAELNRLRKDSGLTRVEVAERIGSTDTTVWRYETGLTRPRPSDVSALTDVYGVTGEARESLIQMAVEARRRAGGTPTAKPSNRASTPTSGLRRRRRSCARTSRSSSPA